ncbi:MAG: hypothetical protein QW594_01415 [Candidatus Woesearchaeota archaeon]
MEIIESLKQWYKIYVTHKDLVTKSILRIEDQDYGYLVIRKENKEHVYFFEHLHEFTHAKDKDKQVMYTLVVPNTLSNFRELAALWDTFVQFSFLKIIFVNPMFTSQGSSNNKWIIIPAVHNKIADKSRLEQGFYGLSEQVPLLETGMPPVQHDPQPVEKKKRKKQGDEDEEAIDDEDL